MKTPKTERQRPWLMRSSSVSDGLAVVDAADQPDSQHATGKRQGAPEKTSTSMTGEMNDIHPHAPLPARSASCTDGGVHPAPGVDQHGKPHSSARRHAPRNIFNRCKHSGRAAHSQTISDIDQIAGPERQTCTEGHGEEKQRESGSVPRSRPGRSHGQSCGR